MAFLAIVALLTGYPISNARLFLAACAISSAKPTHLQYREIKDIDAHAYGMVSLDASDGAPKPGRGGEGRNPPHLELLGYVTYAILCAPLKLRHITSEKRHISILPNHVNRKCTNIGKRKSLCTMYI